ncbi:MAG: class I SAM-dependent methyltransferase [Anaerolineae bacterium]|nr:class I SAM-dependent methyltransferase [Anaerolineae bacterium]
MTDDPLQVTRQTYDANAETYAQINADSAPIQHVLDAFMRHCPGRALLDVGCGPGRDAAYFAARGYRVCGVDLSGSMLRLARQTAPGAAFAQADMRALPFAAAVFDGVWVCASLLHLPKAQAPAAVRAFAWLARPGGIVYVGVKAGAGEALVSAPAFADGERFFAFYQEAEVVALLETAGLRVVERLKQAGWINVFARR